MSQTQNKIECAIVLYVLYENQSSLTAASPYGGHSIWLLKERGCEQIITCNIRYHLRDTYVFAGTDRKIKM